MAYTIVKTDGTVLTTIVDGTINTTSTSLALSGRNYSGWGQPFDTNFVKLTENFASNVPPSNPLRGQLWYNTTSSALFVCPTDGLANANAWLAVATTSSNGNTTFGSITVSGNTTSNNMSVSNTVTSNNIVTSYITISTEANITNATITTATIDTLTTDTITTGGANIPGSMTGTWTVNGTDGGNALIVTGGNLYSSGNIIISDANSIRDPNGNPISFSGTYGNANVANYLPVYGGIVGSGSATFRGNVITTGNAATAGSITGTWTLTANSTLQATYADLAERFAADDIYDPGTVVELGGLNEITSVKNELSEDVFGVVSNTAAYLMNAGAGDNLTHPPIAMSGRVPVKVIGLVKKGQRLVSAGNGTARAAASNELTPFNTIGRALEDKITPDVGVVESVVMIRL